jgi:hypothetical protein
VAEEQHPKFLTGPAHRAAVERLRPVHQAAVERLLPVAAGAILGFALLPVLPTSTRSQDFFAVAAQVIPVLLLALAIETRVFGFGRGVARDAVSRWLYYARLVLSIALLVMFIWAEAGAVEALADGAGVHPCWPQNVALIWGVMTVGGIALGGIGRPRLEATVKWRQVSPNGVIIEASASNVHGDKDVTPLMNLLFAEGLSIGRSDGYGNLDSNAVPEVLPLPQPDGIVSAGSYVTDRLLVTAGDATVRYYVVGGLVPGHKYPVVLRFDHNELRRGRVQEEAWIEVTPAACDS